MRPGDRLLLSDGLIELRVEGTDGIEIQTTVVEGGQLGERKGINAPGVVLPASAITPKDVDDLRFGLSIGVDMVAVSFVQSATDLRQARQLMTEANGADVPLVAKLERPQALEHLDEILESCDAVMVARGDLGLEMPLERVPRAQKEIVLSARRRGIPVIVATQVLESMTHEARPTRAEVSDAANAVDDGVDAIMLAGETAAGAFPRAHRADARRDHPRRGVESVRRGAASPCAGTSRTTTTPGRCAPPRSCWPTGVMRRPLSRSREVAPRRGGCRRFGRVRRFSRPPTKGDGAAARAPLGRGARLHRHRRSRGSVGYRDRQAARGARVRGCGPAVVFININPDLTRTDANYLRIQRL